MVNNTPCELCEAPASQFVIAYYSNRNLCAKCYTRTLFTNWPKSN